MELCDCSLKDILNEYKKKKKGLPINMIKKLLKQLNIIMKKMNQSKLYIEIPFSCFLHVCL